MASISNAVANLYNYTAPVTDASLLNNKPTNRNIVPAAVVQAKLAAESTLVSIGNNKKVDPLTYNVFGLLDNTSQNSTTQNSVLQIQSEISDTLNSLSATAANSPNDILAPLDIPGVTRNRA